MPTDRRKKPADAPARGTYHCEWGERSTPILVKLGGQVSMRTAALALIGLWLLGAGAHTQTAARAPARVRAWSSTNGPYGEVWYLEIQRSGSARVSVASNLGAKSDERAFSVSRPGHDAMLRAADEAKFFELPEDLGPSSLPIHGPQNSLEIDRGGLVRRVFLNDPAAATGDSVSRFRRVWAAVVASSPIKPPL
jgi:hypothetical protein